MSDPREQAFVESFALTLEGMGTPPMLGRVLGLLLICDPPEQPLPGMCEALGASKGAISQATRTLVALNLIERVPMRGSRQAWYRLRDDAWLAHMRGDIARCSAIHTLADAGLASFADAPDARTARLRELRDMYAWYERRLPELAAEWQRVRAQGES